MNLHGFLSQGASRLSVSLPHPDLPKPIKRVVLEACREAWTRLRTTANCKGDCIDQWPEDKITGYLKEILNALMREEPQSVPGFTGEIFETVVRDAATLTYDGLSLDKKPDLVFRMVSGSPGLAYAEYQGLFTECKIVDRHHRPVSLYCSKGLARFVGGQYGWAMQCGLMLGYARAGNAVDPVLKDALRRAMNTDTDQYHTKSLPIEDRALGDEPLAHCSVHERNWSYADGQRPGKIELMHLWLD